MILFIFVVSIVNLGLGYGLAAALANPPPTNWRISFRLPKFTLRWPRRSFPKQAIQESAAQAPSQTETQGAIPASQQTVPALANSEATINNLPQAWLDQLAGANLQTNSFVEAAVQILRLDVTRYREQLLTAEWRARQAMGSADAAALNQLRSDLSAINAEWLGEQAVATTAVIERRGEMAGYAQMGVALERVLCDQAAQIKSTSSQVAALNFEKELQHSGKRLLSELGRLIELAHSLRDQMHEVLAAILRNEDRLGTIPRNLQTDITTGLLNRTGLEVLFHDWWQADPDRTRIVSLVLIDVDRLGKLNERLGTRTGDRALQAFGQLVQELIRRDRGFDRIGRLSGQTFLLFMGDTGPHNATSAIERIRQTLEATTFDYEGTEFELTASCGVISMGAKEGITSLLERIGRAVREAKQGGRNRTAIDEGQGPELIDPPTYKVKGRLIPIKAE